MCRNVKMQSFCPTCNAMIAENTDKVMCGDARRGGRGFGRCSTGVLPADREFRGRECRGCAQITEAQMNELEMRDFAARGLGWGGKRTAKGRGKTAGQDESDDEKPYTW